MQQQGAEVSSTGNVGGLDMEQALQMLQEATAGVDGGVTAGLNRVTAGTCKGGSRAWGGQAIPGRSCSRSRSRSRSRNNRSRKGGRREGERGQEAAEGEEGGVTAGEEAQAAALRRRMWPWGEQLPVHPPQQQV